MVQIKSESMFKSNTLSIQREGLIFTVICWPLKVNMKHHKDSVLCISKWTILFYQQNNNNNLGVTSLYPLGIDWIAKNGIYMTGDWRGWKY